MTVRGIETGDEVLVNFITWKNQVGGTDNAGRREHAWAADGEEIVVRVRVDLIDHDYEIGFRYEGVLLQKETVRRRTWNDEVTLKEGTTVYFTEHDLVKLLR